MNIGSIQLNIANIQYNTSDYTVNNHLKENLENIRHKRIKNELLTYYSLSLGVKNNFYGRFIKNYDVKIIDIHIENNEINATFLLPVTNEKKTLVNIIFTKQCYYPFKPPNVKIFNSFDYISLLKIDPTQLNKMGITHTSCLCCSSILCKNNWNIQKNLSDVFNEIQENLKIKSRLIDRFFAQKIVDTKFGFFIPLVEFL
tara:strand:+ start:96 stop:695 length:600 start_codon:yes stop_codon:yes gene_type:complete